MVNLSLSRSYPFKLLFLKKENKKYYKLFISSDLRQGSELQHESLNPHIGIELLNLVYPRELEHSDFVLEFSYPIPHIINNFHSCELTFKLEK